jgi:hypothetical protein
MNDLDLRNQNIAVYTPDVVTQAGVEAAIFKCRSLDTILSLEVHASATEQNRSLLARLGFVVGGTATRGTQVLVKYRMTIRRSGDGLNNPDLAVPAPVLAPSDGEKRAVAEFTRSFDARYSDAEIERRAAMYKAGLL